MGKLMKRWGKADESRSWYDRAIATLEPIHNREPGHERAGTYLREAREGRAELRSQSDDHAKPPKN
jgi:hypothetical protein